MLYICAIYVSPVYNKMANEVTPETPLFGLTVGQLTNIIRSVVNESPVAAVDQNPQAPLRTSNLSYNEASEFLNSNGYKMTSSTLHQLVHYRKVPYSKFGRSVIFDGNELLEWAESNRNKKLTR